MGKYSQSLKEILKIQNNIDPETVYNAAIENIFTDSYIMGMIESNHRKPFILAFCYRYMNHEISFATVEQFKGALYGVILQNFGHINKIYEVLDNGIFATYRLSVTRRDDVSTTKNLTSDVHSNLGTSFSDNTHVGKDNSNGTENVEDTKEGGKINRDSNSSATDKASASTHVGAGLSKSKTDGAQNAMSATIGDSESGGTDRKGGTDRTVETPATGTTTVSDSGRDTTTESKSGAKNDVTSPADSKTTTKQIGQDVTTNTQKGKEITRPTDGEEIRDIVQKANAMPQGSYDQGELLEGKYLDSIQGTHEVVSGRRGTESYKEGFENKTISEKATTEQKNETIKDGTATSNYNDSGTSTTEHGKTTTTSNTVATPTERETTYDTVSTNTSKGSDSSLSKDESASSTNSVDRSADRSNDSTNSRDVSLSKGEGSEAYKDQGTSSKTTGQTSENMSKDQSLDFNYNTDVRDGKSDTATNAGSDSRTEDFFYTYEILAQAQPLLESVWLQFKPLFILIY